MTSQEMMKSHAPDGFIFQNVAAVDEPQDWVLTKKPAGFDVDGDPNGPTYRNKLFGYDQTEFMAKQYK